MIMDIKINANELNLKSKEKFSNDEHLESLIQYIFNNSEIANIHKLTNRFFYCYNLLECEEEYKLILELEETNFQELTHLYNIFKKWNPYEKYNIRELRGFFFEELTTHYLKSNDKKIIRESNIVIGDYKSHTWDLIIKEECYFIECKMYYSSIKRSTIDKMVSIRNKLSEATVFLSSYTNKNLISDHLMTLQKDTSDDKYDLILKNITIISIEDYQNKHLI